MPQDTSDSIALLEAAGWLIEVSMPLMRIRAPRQLVFAAAIDDADQAVQAVRRSLGGLHCAVDARCRLSPRALARLGVEKGQVKSI